MIRRALIAACLLLPVAAIAGESAWTEVAPGVRIRLITTDIRTPDGKTLGAIEVDMPAGTKTYWKIPGETGIPTEMEIDGSSGIAGHSTRWPYPTIEVRDGLTDFVYYGPTVFPVEIAVDGDHPVWKADLSLGICSDICIPAEATIEMPLSFDAPDRGQSIRINQALALTPIPWDGGGEPIAALEWDAGARALVVSLGSPDIDPHSLIADAGGGAFSFGAPQKSPDGKAVLLPLLGGDDDLDLSGRSVQFTFLTDQGAYTASRQVSP